MTLTVLHSSCVDDAVGDFHALHSHFGKQAEEEESKTIAMAVLIQRLLIVPFP